MDNEFVAEIEISLGSPVKNTSHKSDFGNHANMSLTKFFGWNYLGRVGRAVLLLDFFFAVCFWKEKKMKRNHIHHETFTSFSGPLDHGAEVFTQKMFKHSQSKTQEVSDDIKKTRQEKMVAIKSRSRREGLNRD